ncbi:hypothetical protein MSAN_01917300 [Mycena sanguinolenta]|uniref:Uncharacterized protein n=1 Tax=Mycena sanguinolenta TaxID=230812 RepID=A0A8H6XN68_9AGAR|nr:hypothetical protein MSAN_01917300 [Mycena sanguinolenta]
MFLSRPLAEYKRRAQMLALVLPVRLSYFSFTPPLRPVLSAPSASCPSTSTSLADAPSQLLLPFLCQGCAPADFLREVALTRDTVGVHRARVVFPIHSPRLFRRRGGVLGSGGRRRIPTSR